MFELLKKYIDNRVELFKLSMVSVTANLAAKLISSFVILLFSLMIMLLLSIGFSFWIGEALGSLALGFFIVSGAYILIFLLYLAVAKNKIEVILKDKVVQASLDAEKEVMQN